jgi:superfamily II DNA or RNA helicase
LPQAIRYGIIPPVHIIGVEIDPDLSMDFEDIELRRFKGIDKEHPADVVYDYDDYMYIAEHRNYFFPKAFTVTNCSLKQRLTIIEKELAFWRSKMDDYPWVRETRFLPLGGMRKTILANYKNSFMPYIQQHLQGKRYVVFNENIEQIESNDGTSVHSKIKKKTNLEAIEDFNSGKVDVLQVAKMLNEGINLKNIDAVVILALTTESVQNIQRRGRSVRGDNPTVYALYVKGTKDETNFKEFAKDYKDNLTLMKIEDLFT